MANNSPCQTICTQTYLHNGGIWGISWGIWGVINHAPTAITIIIRLRDGVCNWIIFNVFCGTIPQGAFATKLQSHGEKAQYNA